MDLEKLQREKISAFDYSQNWKLDRSLLDVFYEKSLNLTVKMMVFSDFTEN